MKAKRRIFSAFLALLMVVLVLPTGVITVSAETYSGKCGYKVTWNLDTSTGVLTISGTGAMTDYISLSSSRAPWYSYRSSIKTVTIEDGVTSIGNYAFYECSSLTSITIPDSVTSIGDSAFSFCSRLTSITVDVNNPNYCSIDGNLYNKNATTLIQYAIGKTDTSFTIPDSVTSIGYSAFSHCSSLTSITIPAGVTSIGNVAFYNCSSLTSITIPDSVTSIGNSAFYDCRSLTSITIPDSVTSIGFSVFEYCSSLTSITIPDSVTSIGDSAFENCSSLTSITIPDSVTSIGDSAFSGCTNLIQKENGVHYVDKWVIDSDTSVTSVTLREDTVGIGDYAFYDCSSLTSITIPDSVTSIGKRAFWNCSSLTSITIPDSVTSIGNYAFDGCSSLTSITIGDGVTSIGNSAFWNCSSLTSITIPDSVTSIGDSVFYNCSSLTSITIPDSVTSIGSSAFRGCSSLTSITIGDGVTSIGSYAFYDCSCLTSIIYRGTPAQWNAITKGSNWNSYTGSYTVTYHTHTYEEVITTAPTHTTEGVKTFTCFCGKTYTETIAKLTAHEWDNGVITTAPTCTTEGVKTYTCECGKTYTEEIPALGHSYNHHQYNDAQHKTVCDCGDTFYEEHTWGNLTVLHPATHTSLGLQFHVCEDCGKILQSVIPKLPDHEWGQGEITLAPTVNADGIRTYTCTCGETKTESIPKLEIAPEAPVLTVSDRAVMKGNTVTVPVTLTQNCGIAGMILTVNYDTTAMTLTGVSNGALFSTLENGENIVLLHSRDVLTDGVVVTLTFTVNSDAPLGDYEISCAVQECTNQALSAVTLSTVSGVLSVEDFAYGDATGDGKVDLNDAVLVKGYLANYDYDTGISTTSVASGADANADGKIDLNDAVLLALYLANFDYDTGSSTVVLGPQNL